MPWLRERPACRAVPVRLQLRATLGPAPSATAARNRADVKPGPTGCWRLAGILRSIAHGYAGWMSCALFKHAYEARIGMPALIFVVDFPEQFVAIFRLDRLQYRIDLGFHPIVAYFRLRGADMQKKCKSGDLPDQLEDFRLPVFQRIAQHLNGVGA